MPHRNKVRSGSRVKGKFGELVDPPGGVSRNVNEKKRRRVRKEVYGTVIDSSSYKTWNVWFDYNGEIRKISSHALQVVDSTAGMPLNEGSAAPVSIL